MNFAPMLSVLFIAARMRALQLDPVHGAPQPWAQRCFYACTWALLAQTLLTAVVVLVLDGSAKMGKVEGDIEYKTSSPQLTATLLACRFVILLCIYAGFTAVIWSVFVLEDPRGSRFTPPISSTMQFVINLTVQFFVIYLLIWIFVSVREFTEYQSPQLTRTMENAKATVQFCPMLAILFVGARMRALQLTGNRGAPQGWVQDGMFMATWAIFIQFVMVLLASAATGDSVFTNGDGNVEWEPRSPTFHCLVQTVRWLAFVLLYGGALTVVVGVYTMTPETANGRGALPLVGDGRVPGLGLKVPLYGGVPEPVGVNDALRPGWAGDWR